MASPVGVGIVGANPDGSWSAFSHIPALASLPEFELRAVATSRAESAAAASEAFNVPAFHSSERLLADPEVELVVVSVGVPSHRPLVLAALSAGKSVWCEWPLGNGLAEALEMQEAAQRHGARTVVGLQARASPIVNYVRDLVAEGYVGTVLSSTLTASCWVYGKSIAARNAYMRDHRNGANGLTIQTMHLLDALCYCLGEFRSVSASTEILRPQIEVEETGEPLTVSTPDQIAVTGTLASGALVSMHLRGGASRGPNLRWEISGTDGELVLTGPTSHLSNDDVGVATLHGGREEEPGLVALEVPERYYWAPPDTPQGPPYNVAQLYRLLARGPADGRASAPTFDTAVRTHQLLDAIERSAKSGTRQDLPSVD